MENWPTNTPSGMRPLSQSKTGAYVDASLRVKLSRYGISPMQEVVQAMTDLPGGKNGGKRNERKT